MPRIRTIKPELSQSETLAKCSRDARLTFIYLITISDDFGRIKGSAKLLARQLFPLDDDAPHLIDTWLNELEAAKCIVRYESEGQHFVCLPGWSSHQKVDKPTPSKLPPPPEKGAPEQEAAKAPNQRPKRAKVANPRESSRTFANPPDKVANPRESSRTFANPPDKVANPRESSRLARGHDQDLDQELDQGLDLDQEKEKEKDQEREVRRENPNPEAIAADAALPPGQIRDKNPSDPDPNQADPPDPIPTPSELAAMGDEELRRRFGYTGEAVYQLELHRRRITALRDDGQQPKRGGMKRIGEVTGA